MCSIFGHVSFSNKLFDKKKIIAASNLMSERGPDNKSYLSDNTFYQFAFNRLAILDLEDTGNQPMISNCGKYIILFNGEIYNYKKIYNEIKTKFVWNGSSDTEVFLNAWSLWKEKVFDRIDGMFATAIWDIENKKLVLARDRIGEKPLYYYHNEETIIFSSRPKSILSVKPQLKYNFDIENLNFYLNSGFFLREKSFFSKIKKLEPGTFISIDQKEFKIKKYWDLNNFYPDKINENSISYNADKCEELLKESITERLTSDKPLGFFLSGGIDSSLITAIASQIVDKKKIFAFNLGFHEKEYDESEDAENVSNYLGINLNKTKLSSNQLLDFFDTFKNNFDEPFSDSSCFPLLAISKFAKKKVDVVLTGDGGDELFGGYKYYSIIDFINKFNFSLNIIKYIFSLNFIFKNTDSHRVNLFYNLLKRKKIISKFSFARSIKKDFQSILTKENENFNIENVFNDFANKMNKNSSSVDKSMKLDILTTLNDNYLHKSDLSTMAYSLECRSPFLSKKIIEWSQRLPSKQKVNLNKKKIILKEIAKKYLPEEIIKKNKRGFEIPVKNWLRNELKDWALDLICDERNYNNLPLDREKIKDLYQLHLSRKRDCHPYLWSILMLLNYNKNNYFK